MVVNLLSILGFSFIQLIFLGRDRSCLLVRRGSHAGKQPLLLTLPGLGWLLFLTCKLSSLSLKFTGDTSAVC